MLARNDWTSLLVSWQQLDFVGARSNSAVGMKLLPFAFFLSLFSFCFLVLRFFSGTAIWRHCYRGYRAG